jgi:hypothetical protein
MAVSIEIADRRAQFLKRPAMKISVGSGRAEASEG